MPYLVDLEGLPLETARAIEALVESLRVEPPPQAPVRSMFDAIGKAENPRSAEELMRRAAEERAAWGNR